MVGASLAIVLQTLTRAEKLDYLARLCPTDAVAITLLIDDCLSHRWPKTPADWFAIAERVSAKH